MPNYRAMAILQGRSGLPEDRFVNTFHFSGTGSHEADDDLIVARLTNFYTEPAINTGNPLGQFLSNYLTDDLEIRTYNLSDPEPRVPITTVISGALDARAENRDLPEEVALCLSFKADPPETPRRRGRVYVGPFNVTAVTPEAAAGGPGRPNESLVNTLVGLGNALLASSQNNPRWVIHSPTTGLFPIVTNGWVDNSFDTQRRRGVAPSSRVEFAI